MKNLIDRSLIIIPARLAATRLPNKPMLNINGRALILRVLDLAKQTNIKNICLTSPDQKILNLAADNGFLTIKTSFDCKTGSDRIFEAWKKLNLDNIDFIINLQGDMINFKPSIVNTAVECFSSYYHHFDIATLIVEASQNEAKKNSVVKVAVAELNYNKKKSIQSSLIKHSIGSALYFSRCNIPFQSESKNPKYFKHLGIYIFKPESLKKFVAFPQSNLEKLEQLEQLRALENNMNILTILVDSSALSIDTKSDLLQAEKILAK